MPGSDSHQYGSAESHRNAFRVRLRLGENERSGELTYDLTQPQDGRRLLRLDEADALALFGEALSRDRGWERFQQRMRQRGERRVGNVQLHKSLVIEVDGSGSTAVAVHRFGPVACYRLPETDDLRLLDQDGQPLELEFRGERFVPRIAVYANTGRPTKDPTDPRVLMQAYAIAPRQLFQKYLEDVGEHMHDIQHHLSRRMVWQRGFALEAVLAESLRAKLRQITRLLGMRASSNSTKKDRDAAAIARRDIWEPYATEVMVAGHAVFLSLYLLNELYPSIGHQSKGSQDKDNKYRQRFFDTQALFRKIAGDEAYDSACNSDPLYTLRQAFEMFQSGDDALQPTGLVWLDQVVEFARFVRRVRLELGRDDVDLQAGVPRVFFSGRHEDTFAEEFRHKAEQAFGSFKERNSLPASTQVLRVDASPGQDIRGLIRARIWLADSVVVAMGDARSDNISPEPWKWVASEIEHATHIGKDVRIFMSKHGDPNGLRDVMQRAIGALEPDDLISPSDHRHEHEKRLADAELMVARRAAQNLQLGGWAVDKELEDHLEKIDEQTREDHVRRIVRGCLKRFPYRDQTVIALMLHALPQGSMKWKQWIERAHEKYPGITAEYGKGKSSSSNTTEEIWAQAANRVQKTSNDRLMRVLGQEVRLFQRVEGKTKSGKTNQWRNGVSEIIGLVWPKHARPSSDANKLLDTVLSEFPDNFPNNTEW